MLVDKSLTTLRTVWRTEESQKFLGLGLRRECVTWPLVVDIMVNIATARSHYAYSGRSDNVVFEDILEVTSSGLGT